MNRFIKSLLMGSLLLSLFGCKEKLPLETVKSVDLSKYIGTWYEIARLPNSFEDGLTCCSATYAIRDDGKISVLNAGYNATKGSWKDAVGFAWQPDPTQFPGQLKVTFFWPFAGDYYIFYLDDDYQHVMIGEPTRTYFWLLSRSKEISSEKYNELIGIAKLQKFDTTKLLKVDQSCQPR